MPKTVISIINTNFHNLSSYQHLNKTLLGFGAKFCPDPKPLLKSQLQQSLSDFCKRLTTYEYFKDIPSSNTAYNPKLKTLPSRWTPPENPTLEIQENIYRKRFTELANKFTKPISKTSLHESLREIRNDGRVVITTSDKNLGLTALDTTFYFKSASEMLKDPKTYRKLAPDEFYMHQDEMVTTFLNFVKLRHTSLTRQERKFLSEYEVTVAKFHVLPKLHKTPITFRPIVGNRPSNPTSKLSIWLSQKLQSITKTIPTILKDSNQLLDDLKSSNITLLESDILFTIDFSSLYTNIPLWELYRTIESVTERDSMLAEATKIICENNYFTFAGNYYHQLDGIAMGTSAAVHFANIYLSVTTDRYATGDALIMYRRYIDDVFGIFRGTNEEFLNFIEDFKSTNPTIGITFTHSKTSVDFLDISFYVEKNKLQWRTHQKELNKFQYLIPSTCHPKHTLKGYIKGECIRYIRTCSTAKDYYQLLNLFRERLSRRGYKREFLDKIFSTMVYTENYQKSQNVREKLFPLILPYTKNNLNTLLEEELRKWSNSYKGYKFIIGYQKPPNMISLVSRSELSPAHLKHIDDSSLAGNPQISTDQV